MPSLTTTQWTFLWLSKLVFFSKWICQIRQICQILLKCLLFTQNTSNLVQNFHNIEFRKNSNVLEWRAPLTFRYKFEVITHYFHYHTWQPCYSKYRKHNNQHFNHLQKQFSMTYYPHWLRVKTFGPKLKKNCSNFHCSVKGELVKTRFCTHVIQCIYPSRLQKQGPCTCWEQGCPASY